MAKVTVAAFYADVPDKPSRFAEYLLYAATARKALELTNPGAEYVILSDIETAAKWSDNGFKVAPCAHPGMPLMRQIIDAQRFFVASVWDRDGLLVLPDIDAMPNKKLDDATPDDMGLAITYKSEKHNYRINNLAYVRDANLGAWFLERAGEILATWPVEQQHWWGDQDAWGAACGTSIADGTHYWIPIQHIEAGVFVAMPNRDKPIYLFPCHTHNCPMANNGEIKLAQTEAYFVHFKGPRKELLNDWFKVRFGNEVA